MAVYYIGGSPCSGKSTVAEALSRRYGLQYFKVDDHLDRYMKAAAADGREICARVARMTPEQIWMRDPAVQCREELMIYDEIYAYVMTDLNDMRGRGDIIAEGAAFLPVLAKRESVPFERYISLTPVKAFQVNHYMRREWVPFVLEGCSDKAAAFANWMDRDALFAQAVQLQCGEAGYVSIVNDGNVSVEDMIARIAAHFSLT